MLQIDETFPKRNNFGVSLVCNIKLNDEKIS